MTGRVRVVPAPGSRPPSDAPILIDSDDPGEVFVEPGGEGRFVVHGADGVDRWAWLDGGKRRPDGRAPVEVVVDGWRFELEVEDDARATLRERATLARDEAAATGPLELRAAIPGRVVAVAVTAGDEVEAGATVLVVEAMKMQNELRSSRGGRVERVAVGAGDTIELGDLLAVIA